MRGISVRKEPHFLSGLCYLRSYTHSVQGHLPWFGTDMPGVILSALDGSSGDSVAWELRVARSTRAWLERQAKTELELSRIERRCERERFGDGSSAADELFRQVLNGDVADHAVHAAEVGVIQNIERLADRL